MSEFKLPQNRPNWILADFILSPAVQLLIWVVLVRFFSYRIYEWLAAQPGLLNQIHAGSKSAFMTQRWVDLYVMHFKGLLAFLVGFVGFLLSFNPVVPGLGRQAFILFKFWQVNRFHQTLGMRKLHRNEHPIFPPMFRVDDEQAIKGMKTLDGDPKRGVLLGLRKRFRQDLEADSRLKKTREKVTDYEPFIMGRAGRFRHVLVVGGSGSGKTASIIAPMMRNDILTTRTGVLCINPKADKYLLQVAVDPVLVRRETPDFRRMELEYREAVLQGETRTMARWAWEVKKTSIKPFALISLTHSDLSLAYDPMQFGDADKITKKIVYSSDAIMGHQFYGPKQEAWVLSFVQMLLSDYDLKGRIGLRHMLSFVLDPQKNLGEALSGIVDVDAEIKFPHLASKIRWQREYERLLSQGNKEAVQEMGEEGGLSPEEHVMITRHNENRTRFRNLCSEPSSNLGGLISHISQLVEDESISGIFTDSDRPSLNFREVLAVGGVIYIEVPTQAKMSQAKAIARMLMLELQSYSADRDSGAEAKDCDVYTYVDEFGSLSYDDFIGFIDKARSSNIGITLAHQSLANLSKRHLSDSFSAEIMDNTATKIILGVQDVGTQHYFQHILGEVEVLRASVSESETKGGVGVSRGINRGHVLTKEFVVSESDLSTKRGYGFMKVLEDDQSVWRGAVSLSYLAEGKLRSFSACRKFLLEERNQHASREKPYYIIGQNGRLIDPALKEEVRAGMFWRTQQGFQATQEEDLRVSGASESEEIGDAPEEAPAAAGTASVQAPPRSKKDDPYATLFGG